MKVRLALFLVFALAACGAPNVDEAGPPPADYKDVIKANPPNMQPPAKKTASRKNLDGLFDSFGDHDLVSPYYLHGVEISDPQPGRLEFIPGWRVCLRASVRLNPVIRSGDEVAHVQPVYSDPKTWAYFFVKGQLDKIVKDDSTCDHYTYTSWPELSDVDDKLSDQILHPKWEYGTHYDYLIQAEQSYASLRSKNHYDLAFPFNGGTYAALIVIKTGAGLKARLQLVHGAFDCNGGCDMKMRFDSAPIEALSFERAEGAKKSEIDVTDSARLIERLKASHDLVLEVPLVSNGNKQFIFRIEGLDLTQLGTNTIAIDPFAKSNDNTNGSFDLPTPAKKK